MSGTSEAHRGIRGVIAALGRALEGPAQQQARRSLAAAEHERENRRLSYARSLSAEELAIALSEAPAPRHGSVEAQTYAFACKVFREHGPDEASRQADRFVYFIQMLSREA